MHNYFQIRKWHAESDVHGLATSLSLLPGLAEMEDEREEEMREQTNTEQAFDKSYVHQKLDNGLIRIWRVSV